MSKRKISKYLAILSLITIIIYIISRMFMTVHPDSDIGIHTFPSAGTLPILIVLSLFLVSSISYFLFKK